jgi:hypothetical protein
MVTAQRLDIAPDLHNWRLVSDSVMGGVSSGSLLAVRYRDRDCLHLHGEVSTANNGGFIQMSHQLGSNPGFDPASCKGLQLTVAGNNEQYNIHLRTDELNHPWESYRHSFSTTQEWREIELDLAQFEPHRTAKPLNASKLLRIGLVAIGRDFTADLYLHRLRLY